MPDRSRADTPAAGIVAPAAPWRRGGNFARPAFGQSERGYTAAVRRYVSRSETRLSAASGFREGEAGMVKRREDGKIGVFLFCLPVDISSSDGCCQSCWSHAKAQRRKVRTEGSIFQQFSLAPLREVKAGIDEPFENGLIGIISFCLPGSLTPFQHPSLAPPRSSPVFSQHSRELQRHWP